jgi:hypothetical protein
MFNSGTLCTVHNSVFLYGKQLLPLAQFLSWKTHLLAVHYWPIQCTCSCTPRLLAVSSISHAMVTGTYLAFSILCCYCWLLYEHYFLYVIVNVYVAVFNTRTRVHMKKRCFSFLTVCCLNGQCITIAAAAELYWHWWGYVMYLNKIVTKLFVCNGVYELGNVY